MGERGDKNTLKSADKSRSKATGNTGNNNIPDTVSISNLTGFVELPTRYFTCECCGMVITVVEEGGSDASNLKCCGRPMDELFSLTGNTYHCEKCGFKMMLRGDCTCSDFVETMKKSLQATKAEAAENSAVDEAVIIFTGRMNTLVACDAEEKLLSLLDREKRVRVDLSGLEFISSSGLKVFMKALKKAKARGAHLILCGLHDGVRQIFDIAGLTGYFEIET